jgi:hypothetical protein
MSTVMKTDEGCGWAKFACEARVLGLGVGLTALVAAGAAPAVKAADPGDAEVALFDGKSLEGWTVVPADQARHWRVEDGVITAGDGKTEIEKNSFLCTAAEFGDFELRFEFKLAGDPATGFINSGLQFRSAKSEDGHVSGYQADIGDPGWWGCLYDEHRRNKVLAASDMKALEPVLKRGDWNSYVVRCEGPRVQLFINGVKSVDYSEPDPDIPRSGLIAPQLHGGGAAQVWFRNLVVAPLAPADASPAGKG